MKQQLQNEFYTTLFLNPTSDRYRLNMFQIPVTVMRSTAMCKYTFDCTNVDVDIILTSTLAMPEYYFNIRSQISFNDKPYMYSSNRNVIMQKHNVHTSTKIQSKVHDTILSCYVIICVCCCVWAVAEILKTMHFSHQMKLVSKQRIKYLFKFTDFTGILNISYTILLYRIF